MPRAPKSSGKLQHRASELRNDPTTAESKLWAYLRLKRMGGARFRRQHAIGRYVVDFCVPAEELVIELDGSQHFKQTAQDAQRTTFLESQGYRVLRFWNNQVLNDMDDVTGAIKAALAKP
jgi:very-short-patch-repair endonuclease